MYSPGAARLHPFSRGLRDAAADRQLRQLHLQPRPLFRRARHDAPRGAQRRADGAGRAGDEARGDRAVPRALRPRAGGHLPAADAGRGGRGRAAFRGLPRPPGDRRGLRRQGGAPFRDRAWQAGADHGIRGQGVFAGLPSPLMATRYHSLVVERDGPARELEITAELEDGTIMGLRHRTLPIEGCSSTPKASGPSTAMRF
jgi:hypothetical protein